MMRRWGVYNECLPLLLGYRWKDVREWPQVVPREVQSGDQEEFAHKLGAEGSRVDLMPGGTEQTGGHGTKGHTKGHGLVTVWEAVGERLDLSCRLRSTPCTHWCGSTLWRASATKHKAIKKHEGLNHNQLFKMNLNFLHFNNSAPFWQLAIPSPNLTSQKTSFLPSTNIHCWSPCLHFQFRKTGYILSNARML